MVSSDHHELDLAALVGLLAKIGRPRCLAVILVAAAKGE